MKNVLIKDTCREIRHSVSRFLSIFLIVALGCGFFSGIKATMPDMVDSAEKYFRENNLFDIRLQSTIGVRSEDVEAVKTADNVTGVMAGYSKDVFYYHDNQNLVLKCLSYNDKLDNDSVNKLNKPVLVEGRLPENDGECMIEKKISSPDSFVIGGTLTFAEPDDSKSITDTLLRDTYKIVGICTSPQYIGYKRDATNVGNGTIVSNVYLPESEFKTDYYTDMYVTLDGLGDCEPFSDEYREMVEEQSRDAVSIFKNNVNARYESLVSDAQKDIDKAEETASSLTEILSCNDEQLKAYALQANKALDDAQTAYDNADSLSRSMYKIQLAKAQQAQDIVEALLNDMAKGSNEARREFEKQLSDLQTQIKTGQESLDAQKNPVFYTYDRFDASTDYSSYNGDANKIDSIAKVFPVFFILVAALVCLTTMTRMVEEQRVVIGTYKALGYGAGRIAGKYLSYGAVAAVFGSCIGTDLGLKIFPYIIFSCYKILYNIPSIDTPFRLSYMILCCIVSVVCICSAVLYACFKELKAQPSQLMRPKPPQSGRRVLLERAGFVWNRLSFLSKVTVRNLLRYKKRFFMSLVGVAGCTALIITGFGLKNSIKTIVDKQFGEIFTYDGIVVLNSQNYSQKQLDEKLKNFKQISEFSLADSENGTVDFDGNSQDISVVTMEKTDLFGNFIKLSDVESKKNVELQDDSAVITQKLAMLLDINVGDSIKVNVDEKKSVTLNVSAVVENYAIHYVYITPTTYEKIYAEKPDYNVAYFNLEDNTDDEMFKSQLISNDEFYGVSLLKDAGTSFLDSIESLNAVVILLIVCAGLLAVVVLYNLANINITERVREIATIKVLGFYDKETSAYIYRESIISSALGILIGFAMGIVLHHFVVTTAEVDIVLFNRQLVWWAYVLGAALTAVFTVIVNLLLHLKLKKIDMVESMKSVE